MEEFSNDTFSSVFRQTIHGPGIDEPLAIIGDRPGEYTYYLHDGLGSVTVLVDAAGNLDGCYDYGAFGDERQNTVMIENRYRYTSREYVEPNLYYYRARYMRPDLGRFMSMDPLKMIDGTNMVGYVGNDPVFLYDPFGLELSDRDIWKKNWKQCFWTIWGLCCTNLLSGCGGVPGSAGSAAVTGLEITTGVGSYLCVKAKKALEKCLLIPPPTDPYCKKAEEYHRKVCGMDWCVPAEPLPNF